MSSPDTLNQPDISGVGRQLVRRAEGDELFALLEELEPFSAHPAVDLPCDPEGRIDPMVKMTSNRDIGENRSSIGAAVGDPEGVVPGLVGRFPDMARSMHNVTVSGVDWNRPSRRFHKFHYLSLLLDVDSTFKLTGEQKDIWQGMQDMGGDERRETNGVQAVGPDWEIVPPSILVIKLAASVGSSAPKKILSHLERKGAFDLTLLPLGESRPSED